MKNGLNSSASRCFLLLFHVEPRAQSKRFNDAIHFHFLTIYSTFVFLRVFLSPTARGSFPPSPRALARDFGCARARGRRCGSCDNRRHPVGGKMLPGIRADGPDWDRSRNQFHSRGGAPRRVRRFLSAAESRRGLHLHLSGVEASTREGRNQ